MSGLISAAMIAIFAAVCGSLLKRVNREAAIVFSVGVVILILLRTLPDVTALFDAVHDLTGQSGFGDILSVLLKTLGIVLVSRFSVEICKEAGENAAALGVELAAKTAVVVVLLPLAEQMLTLFREALSL